MSSEHTRFHQWEGDLIWLWDAMLDAERGRARVSANTLARLAVDTVKAHIADAAQVPPASRPADERRRSQQAALEDAPVSAAAALFVNRRDT